MEETFLSIGQECFHLVRISMAKGEVLFARYAIHMTMERVQEFEEILNVIQNILENKGK